MSSLFTYNGVTQLNTPIATGSGYDNLAAATGSTGMAFNPNGVSPSDFFLVGNSASTFTLNSFLIAGAWGTQTLTIRGLNNGVQLFSQALAVSLSPVLFTANWSGIDQFEILTGNDFVQNQTLTGSGQHWALDNLTINEAAASVPEPSTLAIVALGLVGLGLARRKQAA
ncbi:PEP-CTERM sorting domain-containing protein [Uliginosibacterium sp. H3]|uniref:PEP-CTERM sorting domain-containing protein n=1 Tax=Uliginosibacterium silvisoli TaxID=3114758 RepID=A0ABU6K0U4_9RHOO|nr:PEP-CTERM sorting domain-containing protein [Uliginosibacterium sp. H3]